MTNPQDNSAATSAATLAEFESVLTAWVEAHTDLPHCETAVTNPTSIRLTAVSTPPAPPAVDESPSFVDWLSTTTRTTAAAR